MKAAWSIVLVAALIAAGCNARQDTPIEPDQAAKLAQQVKVYQASDLANVKYTIVGPVDADSCKWMLWDQSPTEQGVTEQLLQKASAMNANGVTDLKCDNGTGSALARDCWSRIACTAQAINVK
jgi:RcsF lipoprotein